MLQIFGLQLDDMLHALGGRPHRRGRVGHHRVVAAGHEPRAGTGGQVDHDVGAAVANPLHDFPIMGKFHRRTGGLRVAHMDMDDGGAGLGGGNAGFGDFFRRHRHGGVLAGRVGRAGEGAGDHHFAGHLVSPRSLHCQVVLSIAGHR